MGTIRMLKGFCRTCTKVVSSVISKREVLRLAARRSLVSMLVLAFLVASGAVGGSVILAQTATKTTLAAPQDISFGMMQGSDGDFYST